jgi:serine/threonine protein kinase
MAKRPWDDRWVRVEHLSGGGQGLTYLARASTDPPDKEPQYVLKELKNQKDPERRARMYQEVAQLRVLQHSNIAKYVDSNADRFETDEPLFLVMERVFGQPLSKVADGRPQPLEVAEQVVSRLVDILEYCHRNGVVHRDIKPDNLVLRNSSPSEPVLLDFGLSFNAEIRAADFSTEPEQHIGNRFLLLPEHRVRSANKRDPVSDVTQCVGIFFYLLTGMAPEVLLDHSNHKPHERSAGRAILSKLSGREAQVVSRIFDVGFNQEPIRRWTSAKVLREELALLRSLTEGEPSFEEQLRELRRRVEASPVHLVAAQTSMLSKAADICFQEALNTVLQGLGGAVAGGALLFSPPQRSDSGTVKVARIYSLFLKHDPSVKVDLTLRLIIDNTEALIEGVIDGARREVSRFGLFHPDPEAKLREAAASFFFEAVSQRFG